MQQSAETVEHENIHQLLLLNKHLIHHVIESDQHIAMMISTLKKEDSHYSLDE